MMGSGKTAIGHIIAKKLNSPIFADILSNMREGRSNNINVYYDYYIDYLTQNPDFILRFGKKPVSKKLNEFFFCHLQIL